MRPSFHLQQAPWRRWFAHGLVLAVVSLSADTIAFEVQSDPYLEGWRWIRFGVESGLPSEDIFDLVETPNETLWVLTSGGLAWFDGFKWRPVPIEGIDVFDRSSRLTLDRTGRLIVLANGQLFRGDATGFALLSLTAGMRADSRVLNVAPLNDGRLALQFANYRLAIWDGSRTDDLALPKELGRSPEVFCGLIGMPQGEPWITSDLGTFIRTDKGWVKEFEHKVNNLFVSRTGERLAIVADPWQRGVWTWKEGDTPRRIGEDSLAVAFAADVAPNGDAIVVWTTGQVQARRDGQWRHLTLVRSELDGAHLVKFQRNGDLWSASSEGLFVCHRSLSRWQRWPIDDQHVHALLRTRDGKLLAAHTRGLSIMHADGSYEPVHGPDGAPSGPVTGLAEDAEGAIWISSGATFSGAYRWFDGQWQHFGPEEGLPVARFHRILKDSQERLWFLGLTAQDVVLDPREEPGAFVLENGRLTGWGRNEGLPSGRVYAFTEGADGSYWFGTLGGLSRWRDGRWTHWSRHDGLRSDKVFVLVTGADGRIWFGHQSGSGGLGYIRGDDAPAYLDMRHGMADAQVWDLQVAADDSLWIAADRGLARYRDGAFVSFNSTVDLEGVRPWPVLPERDRVYFGTLGFGLFSLDLHEQLNPAPLVTIRPPMTRKDELVLAWTVHPYHAEVSHHRVETRFRLNDETWSPWSLSHSATLAGVPAGEHRVVVQAKSLFGNVDPEGTALTFHVPPPFWRHPLFVAVAVIWLTLIVLLAAILWRRHHLQQRLLREREQKYRGIFDESVSAIYIVNKARRFTDSNQSGLDLLGYTRDELLALHVRDVDADPDTLRPAHERLLSGERIVNFEHRLRRKDGTVVTVLNNSRPLTDADGRIQGSLSTIVDITERKQAEAAIVRARDEWERTFNAVPDLIMVMDEQQRIVRMNKAMADRLGRSTNECVGTRCCELVHGADEPPAYCPHAMIQRDGREHTAEVQEPLLDGVFATSAFPLTDENGDLVGCVYVARDITEEKRAEEDRKTLEERLRIAQRMDAVGTLAAGIAHDFNNFLMAILAYARSVDAHVEDNEEAARSIDGIRQAAQQAADLTGSLLSFGRSEPVSREPLDLTEVVARSVKLIGHSIPATIELVSDDPGGPSVWVEGNSTQLGQLIVNLALNAKDAMPNGGRLDIAVQDEPAPGTDEASPQDGQGCRNAVIVVEDTGDGMSADIRDHLFDPFFTTKARGHGTGLGMAVVHSIVTAHGGSISVDSAPGKGTRVTVMLPACDPPFSVSHGDGIGLGLQGDADGNGAVVLFAEDNEHVRPILSSELREAGYNVLEAADGATAVEVIRRRPRDLDLLILDVDLPHVSGPECLREARKLAPDVPAILISGLPEVRDQAAAQNAILLQKPFEVNELLEVARGLMGKSARRT